MCYNLVEIDHQKYLKHAVAGTCTNSCIHPKRLKKITTCSHFSLQMIRVWNSAGEPLNVEAQSVNSIITKKAFNSVRRDKLWNILKHYDIPAKLYDGNSCCVGEH